jgi:predicted negative regulator of RcsB-dependent stress response
MAEKQVQAETVETNETVQRVKGFWAKFSKPIIYGGGAIILLAGGWLGYKYFIKLPKQQEANEKIFPAEKLFTDVSQNGNFTKDSVNILLNGGVLDGTNVNGLLKIINNYSGTPAANLASYRVGACYLQLKEYDNAIKHLKNFDGNGATQIQSAAYRMLGDAYSEKKNNDEALSYYKKAIAAADVKDENTRFLALSRAAQFCEYAGKNNEAIGFLKQIRDEISDQFRGGFDPEKYLAKLGVVE